MQIVEVLISNGLPISARFKIGRLTIPGCIAPRSCVFAVDLPSVEVDSPEDFEVVVSSEIPTILRLPTLNLQIQLFSLLCFTSP
jgi:hypothetical protein